MRTISLDQEGNYVLQGTLPKELQVDSTTFQRLWNLHPKERGQIKMMGKMISTPRWQQSYGVPYWFSGMEHKALPLEDAYLQKLRSWVEEQEKTREKSSQEAIVVGPPEQILLNWYQDEDYIGPHSDDESQLVPSSAIWSFSFGVERDFIIHSKIKKESQRICLAMPNQSFLVMCGPSFQKRFKHSVPKRKRLPGQRINVTFRWFVQKKNLVEIK